MVITRSRRLQRAGARHHQKEEEDADLGAQGCLRVDVGRAVAGQAAEVPGVVGEALQVVVEVEGEAAQTVTLLTFFPFRKQTPAASSALDCSFMYDKSSRLLTIVLSSSPSRPFSPAASNWTRRRILPSGVRSVARTGPLHQMLLVKKKMTRRKGKEGSSVLMTNSRTLSAESAPGNLRPFCRLIGLSGLQDRAQQ